MARNEFYYRDSVQAPQPEAIAEELFQALWQGLSASRIVRIDYCDEGGQSSSRKVLPEVIFCWNERWYLAAYCCFRQQERLFRLDRIAKAHCSAVQGRSRGIAAPYQKRQEPPWLPAPNKDDHDLVIYSRQRSPDNSEPGRILKAIYETRLSLDDDALEHTLRDEDSPGARFYFQDCLPLSYDDDAPKPAKPCELAADLFAACFFDQHDQLLKLLAQGVDVNVKDQEGNSPLLIAALKAELDSVQALIFHGAELLTRNHAAQHVLHAAARNGDTEVTRFLLQIVPELLNASDVNGRTALYEAIAENDLVVVKMFVRAGADLNLRPKNSISPIMAAIRYIELGDYDVTEMVAYLIKQNALLNIKDSDGKTALFHAVEMENYSTVELLLRHHAIPHFCDWRGRTPLLEAVLSGQEKIAKLLLEHGAPPNSAEYESGQTPLLVESISADLCRCLLEHQADPNHVNSDGHNALLVHFERPEILRLLLEHGANAELRDANGNTLMHHAVFAKNPYAICPTLAAKMPWANSANKDGVTPQMLIVQQGMLPLLPDILSAKWNLSQSDHQGRTILDYASEELSRCPDPEIRTQIRQLILEAMAEAEEGSNDRK
jgi:ankyrin repeat protein